MVSRLLLCPKPVFSLAFSLIGSAAGNALDKPLHSIGTLLLHVGGNKPVDVQGEGCRCVSQGLLYS